MFLRVGWGGFTVLSPYMLLQREVFFCFPLGGAICWEVQFATIYLAMYSCQKKCPTPLPSSSCTNHLLRVTFYLLPFPSQNVADPSRIVADLSQSVMYPSESIADPSESIADPSHSVTDPSQVFYFLSKFPFLIFSIFMILGRGMGGGGKNKKNEKSTKKQPKTQKKQIGKIRFFWMDPFVDYFRQWKSRFWKTNSW